MGVVIGLGVLIIVAFGALIAGIVTGGNREHAVPPATATPNLAQTASNGPTALPPGYQIVDVQTQPGRLVLHLRTQSQDEIDIIDLNDGRLIARLRPQPQR